MIFSNELRERESGERRNLHINGRQSGRVTVDDMAAGRDKDRCREEMVRATVSLRGIRKISHGNRGMPPPSFGGHQSGGLLLPIKLTRPVFCRALSDSTSTRKGSSRIRETKHRPSVKKRISRDQESEYMNTIVAVRSAANSFVATGLESRRATLALHYHAERGILTMALLLPVNFFFSHGRARTIIK